MGVPREAGNVVIGIVGAEVIEKEEGIETGDLGKAEDPFEMHAGTLDSGLTVE